MIDTIYATFSDPAMAQKALGAVLDNGVKSEHVSLVFPEGYHYREDGSVTDAYEAEKQAEKGITTTTSADAASGAATGAGIGLAAGALAALTALFVPGIGWVVGGGALALAIGGAAGATAAGAVAGGVTGYLKDQGVSNEDIAEYGDIIGQGGALMTVVLTDEKVSAPVLESVISKYNGRIRTRYASTQTGAHLI